MKTNTYLIINRYLKSRTSDRQPYVTLAYERGGALRKYTKPRVDDEEEEVTIKKQGPYGTKKCECLFKLKASHVLPYNILRFFREQNIGCAVSARKIYNVVAKIKKNRMQGRNTVEEVLCLSAQRSYTVFYRNAKDSNVLSDIVIPHPTSIAIIRTWPYVLIMDTTYKTNKYNMPLLEAVGMTLTGKNFSVVTAFMHNEQAMTYRRKIGWVEDEVQRRLDFLHYLFNTWLNPHVHKFYRVWTSEVLHFGVETMNRAERKHSVLKLWHSMCHGDLDTVFLNIDSFIEGQIAKIKSSLEISKLKEKYGLKSNPVLKNIKTSVDILTMHERDTDSEMRDLTFMLDKISTSLIPKVREVRRLIKGVISLVLPDDPCPPLTTPRKRQSRSDDGRRIQPKGISLIGNTQEVQGLDREVGPVLEGLDREVGPVLGLVLVYVEEDVAVDEAVYLPVVKPDTPSTPFPYIDAFPDFVYEWMPATSIAGPMAISSRYTSQ
ncbi:hypothetical protein M9H77_31572 [Catharanthus roseus]|uniref:Uncharacterized protein n=1 Tax=Catharanthus roseus TaxID=4058 RepID=A0ACC0A0F1_CATRO|nr:hypothetical protein M9H77_31572 [Catharanthus roseus]